MNTTYDDTTHIYRIDDRIVPSVTQIINSFLVPRQCDPWYLGRGSANHACYALLALGRDFYCAPECEPFVAGCRAFFADVKPGVVAMEKRMFSHRYMFAGTLDLVARINNTLMIVDYKGSITESLPYQLSAYAGLYAGETGTQIKHGIGCRITEDGKYKLTDKIKLDGRYWNGFLAMRTVWGIINK